jgi:hypothetical protein
MEGINEPTMNKLSTELLDKIAIEEIIYAEYAVPGAMGNDGGVMIYIICDGNINCYEASVYEDENIYYKAVDILERNSISSRYCDKWNENGIFNFYGGGMGNNVFINKNVSFNITDSSFTYTKNNKKYTIDSSVQGVFTRVAFEMRMKMYEKRLEDYIDEDNPAQDFLDKAEKEKELLQEKLDKEIITGKIYAEKEINEILKICCTPQDHVSFRRSLIDKGYLRRTNDCKAYWRNVDK